MSSTTCDPGTLSYNTHYYWKVVANGLNGPIAGPAWDFWTSEVVISEVRVTNVRDTTFTVSWVTNQSATGEVHYGTDPANLNQSAHDDRGAGTSDDTHYVTLLGLTSNTTYYFDVISNGTTDDNGGVHYTVTTGPTLGLPASDTIYGQVFKEDGTTPAEETMVYITLFDDDGSGSSGQAAEMSSLVDSNGYWSASLGNARPADLGSYFDYSASGDGVELTAQGAGDSTASQTVNTSNDRPAPDMVLGSTDSPEVISFAPSPNAHTAASTTTVSITYNQSINPATVSPQTFAVHAMQTGQLLQTYSVNGGQITLMPDQSLKSGELVQVSATTGALNLSGQGPVSPTVWQFWAAVGSGTGFFSGSGQSLGSSDSWSMALGDVDGDGDLDAFVTNLYQANKVWLNDGTGTFSDSGQSLGSSQSLGSALGDVDGDGDLDAFVANFDGNKVWSNDGTGTFEDSSQSLGGGNRGVALGDMDGDGDLDAFVTKWGANEVWLNDGTGTFSDSGQSLGTAASWGVALGDVDGDGDLDAFIANWGTNKVWLNNGTGYFSDSGQSLGSAASFGVALGDMDGDGDLDAFVGNGGANKVWLNNGTGTFSDSGQSLGGIYSYGVALGDVDGDGTLNAFVGNYDQANKVWLNDGTGTFNDSRQSVGDSDSMAVALGDVDGNGDLDAFVANWQQANRVWLNGAAPPTYDLDEDALAHK